MSNTVFFLNMFPDYAPPEALQEAFSQAAISAADIDPETRTVGVTITSAHYIPFRFLHQASADITQAYGLKGLHIKPVYPQSQLHNMDFEDIMLLFVGENSMTRGSLAGAHWQWEGNTLHIQLAANGKDTLTE